MSERSKSLSHPWRFLDTRPLLLHIPPNKAFEFQEVLCKGANAFSTATFANASAACAIIWPNA